MNNGGFGNMERRTRACEQFAVRACPDDADEFLLTFHNRMGETIAVVGTPAGGSEITEFWVWKGNGEDKEHGKIITRPYTLDDNIDFFVLVLLHREEVFIIPFADTIGKSQITCTPDGFGWQYKDRYGLFI